MEKPLCLKHPKKAALVEDDGRSHTYAAVDAEIQRFAQGILAGKLDLAEERIAFLIPASVEYVIALHGIWRAGGIASPLHIASAEAELQHCLTSIGVTRLFVASDSKLEQMRPLCNRLGIEVKTVRQVLSNNDHDEAEFCDSCSEVDDDEDLLICEQCSNG